MRKIVTTALMCCFAVVKAFAGASEWKGAPAGAVFVATNDVNHNEVIMYSRSKTGTLKYVGHFATGGRGQGGINDPLQSQSSLLVSADHRYLLAVNPGSSTLSLFQVWDDVHAQVLRSFLMRSMTSRALSNMVTPHDGHRVHR